MQNKEFLIGICVFFLYAFAKAQVDSPSDTLIEADAIETVATKEAYDPLRPARAAFYGAILPGLGQAFNKDYWKLPLVYGALGSTIYGVKINSDQAERARTALKDRFAGRIDEFTVMNEDGTFREEVTDARLIDRQNFFQRRRDLFILISAGVYILQIVEANVDAHLSQYDVDDDLTFGPDLYWDDRGTTMNYGMKLTYKF